MIAPPKPPSQDELEALIREARERQLRRRLFATAAVAIAAGVGLAVWAALPGGTKSIARQQVNRGRLPATEFSQSCGVRVADTQILDGSGRMLYREPGNWSPGYPRSHEVRCSGSTIWVVWDNGYASSQEGYVGARSGDAGRTWRLVFAEPYFGVNAPHELDAYMGAWTLYGPEAAYFSGRCPACGYGTVSLWVTKDGGRTFRHYQLPTLTGYATTQIRVLGDRVTISAQRWRPGRPVRKTITVLVP
jgi:hypothetical protein